MSSQPRTLPPALPLQLPNDVKKKSTPPAPPPPPPPPPPLPQISSINETSSTTKPSPVPVINDARAGLLQQIQAGAKLKSVGTPSADKTFVPTNPPTHHDHIMDQIKQGAQLKHVCFYI